jgi:hypothetical protein
MYPIARRLATIAALVAGVLIALVLLLPYIVSLDSTRARILGAAEAALHRKVEAGPIRLQILSGLGAGTEKLAVRNGPGWESPALLSAEKVSVKIAFWPLLSRRVEVRKVVLDGLTIAVERDAKGDMNIADLLAGAPEGGPEPPTPSTPALRLSRLEVSRGRLSFIDRKVVPGETVTVSLDDLTGTITDVGPLSAAQFDLAARFLADSGRNLTLGGSLGPPVAGKGLGDAPFNATFAAKGLALTRLRPYLGKPTGTDPGVLSTDGTLEGALLGPLKAAFNLALVPAGSPSPIPPIEGKLAMTLDWRNGTLAVASSPVVVAKLPLTVEGRIDGLRSAPNVNLRLATPGDVPIDDVTGLPGVSGALPAGVKLAGRARVAAEIEGPSADRTVRASVDAAPFGVSRDGRAVFSAASTRATLGSRGDGPLSGKVTSPSGRIQNLPFEDLVADWSLNKGSLTLTPRARVFRGTLEGRLETDLAHPASESRVRLSVMSVNAQPFVESLTSVRNVIAGVLTANVSLTSRGLGWQALTRTARGEGRLSLANTDLKTVELMPAVTRSLAALGSVPGFRVPADLESTRFTTLATNLRLGEGRVATPGLSLSGRQVSVTADGSLGFDRSLSYQGRVVLGPALVKSFGSAGRYLADGEGRLALPFHVSGQVAAPKVSIDQTIVLDLGKRLLARQVGERVPGGFGKVVGDALEGGAGKDASPFGILQQLLKQPATPTPTPRRRRP